jgi:8-oxo-dGTP diphosphatase
MVTVAGAAIVRSHHLFVARRSRPASMAGYWELPGDHLHDDEDERAALEREFTTEFGISLSCVDHILGDRALPDWRDERDENHDATLRIWRCQLPAGYQGDGPRPNLYRYDDAGWIPIDELDSVGPWRAADRLAADEIADFYRNDQIWQVAD